MAIEVSVQNPRSVKALVLFAQSDLWQQGHTKTGRPFFAIPGSESGLYHMTDCQECSCQDFRRRGSVAAPCKHVMAVRLWMAAFKTGAVSPKRESAATCQDDRAVLLPAGAAYLAAQTAPVADVPAVSAPTAWHYCTNQCGELLAPEHAADFCNHCAAEREKPARKGYAALFPASDD